MRAIMSVGINPDQPVSMRTITSMLQLLPARFHWAFANEDLLRAIPIGIPVKRGRRGVALHAMIKVVHRIGLHWPLLWLVGVSALARMLLRQSNAVAQSPAVLQLPFRIFIGFGAGSEEPLFMRYSAERSGTVLRLDQTSIESFAQWHRIGIGDALSALWYAVVTAKAAMAALPAVLASRDCDFLTFIGMRIADYSYMHAWFGWIKASHAANVEEVGFLAADTCAFAVSDRGLDPVFLQHGLLFFCLLPMCVRVEALNSDEADYFRQELPHAIISLPQPIARLKVHELTGLVLVASIYGEADYLAQINPFLQWAGSEKLRVCVRPHPREDCEFWRSRGFDSYLVVDDSDKDFFHALARLKPRLVISWFSTALADALDAGVIPVTVCQPGDRAVVDMPYPLFQRCLSWPQDSGVIAKLLSDNEYYEAILASLRKEIRGS